MNIQANSEMRDLQSEIFRLKCIMVEAGLETEKEKERVDK